MRHDYDAGGTIVRHDCVKFITDCDLDFNPLFLYTVEAAAAAKRLLPSEPSYSKGGPIDRDPDQIKADSDDREHGQNDKEPFKMIGSL